MIKHGYFAISCISLAAVFTWPDTTRAAESMVPCWFNQPISKQGLGAIGMARNMTISGNPALTSRQRAAQGLIKLLGIDTAEVEVSTATDSTNISGKSYYFSPEFIHKGHVYSYLSESPIESQQQCSISTCRPDLCTPAWLCQPNSGDQVSFLGTSSRGTSPVRQLQSAVRSAAEQAELLYGVSIQNQSSMLAGRDSRGDFRVTQENAQIKVTTEVDAHRYGISDICSTESNLFVRLLLPDLSSGIADIDKGLDWISNPSPEGYSGAVGIVTGEVSSGLLSTKLRLAIERSLIALAKNENINISEARIAITRRSGNQFLVSYQVESTDVTLQARVMDVKFQSGASGITVYVWAIKDQSKDDNSI